MKYKAVRKLVLGQIVFIFSLLTCYIIRPADLNNVHALSEYGASLPTAIPYVFGFLAFIVLMLLAGRDLPKTTEVNRKLDMIFKWLAGIALFVVLTPYSVNAIFLYLHIVAAISLYIAELLIAVWFMRHTPRDAINTMLFCAQILSGIILSLAIDQVGLLNRELVAICQFTSVAAFTLLLLRIVFQVEKVHFQQLTKTPK